MSTTSPITFVLAITHEPGELSVSAHPTQADAEQALREFAEEVFDVKADDAILETFAGLGRHVRLYAVYANQSCWEVTFALADAEV